MTRERKLPPGIYRRGKVYWARFTANGREVRKALSSDLATAKVLLNDLRARADRMDYGLRDNDLTWAELKKSYLQWAKQHLKRAADQIKLIDRFEAFARPKSVEDVTPRRAVEYRAHRLAQTAWEGRKGMTKLRSVAPRTVNKELSAVGGMLRYGVEAGIIASNPLKDLKQLPHPEKRKERRPLTVEEVHALLAASPEHLVPVWRTFIGCAIRRDELVTLRWQDIDFDAGTLTVRATQAKNGKAREIHVHDETLEMLAAMKAQHGAEREHVFATRNGTPLANNLLRQFYTYAQRAGITDAEANGAVDIHSLRGTAATLMLQGGAGPKDVQDILGHSTLALTMAVYAKATESGKRNAIAAIPLGNVKAPSHIVPSGIRTKSGTVNFGQRKTSVKLGVS